jgi:predicted anti-sigma-YlaC factor YlaD
MDGRGGAEGRGPSACGPWREAISAEADGEDPGIDPRLVEAHLARCAGCRTFAAAVTAPPPPLPTSEVAPDLSRRVARLAARTDRAGTSVVVRGLLVVVAVEIIALSLPDVLLGDEQDTVPHAARHLGAFTVAYAVGLLVVAVRPARARTMLPVAAVLAGALLIGAVVDLVQGRVPIVDEMLHVPELVSVVLLWLLAAPGRRRRATAAAPPGLRAVREPGDHHRAAG